MDIVYLKPSQKRSVPEKQAAMFMRSQKTGNQQASRSTTRRERHHKVPRMDSRSWVHAVLVPCKEGIDYLQLVEATPIEE